MKDKETGMGYTEAKQQHFLGVGSSFNEYIPPRCARIKEVISTTKLCIQGVTLQLIQGEEIQRGVGRGPFL